MCGRYQFSLHQYDDLAQILSDAQRRSRQLSELNFSMADPITTPAHGAAADIAPTNIAPVMIASGNRVVGEFQKWLGEQELCKTAVLAYKSHLCGRYAPASVNAVISSLNSFFNYKLIMNL